MENIYQTQTTKKHQGYHESNIQDFQYYDIEDLT